MSAMEEKTPQGDLLAEVKKITAFIEQQKKLRNWAIGISIVIFVGGIIALSLMQSSFRKKMQEEIASVAVEQATPLSWWDVDRDVKMARIDDALKKANQLIQAAPNNYDGHLKLANIYLMRDELETAEQHFKRAYEIFPTNAHAEYLHAIQTRRQASPTN